MTTRRKKCGWRSAALSSLFTIFSTIHCSQGDDRRAVLPDGPLDYSVLIDESFTIQQRAAIVAAGDEWMRKLDGSLTLTYVVTPQSELKETTWIDGMISIISREPGRGSIGWTSWNDGTRGAYILLHPTCCDGLFDRIAAHELGHAFHLRHYLGDEVSIMRPETDETLSRISQRDLRAFCDVWKNCHSIE